MTDYVGSELSLFSGAKVWRRYWGTKVRPYLGIHVLEVGAGLGSTTKDLAAPSMRWCALEPDPHLAEQIRHWSSTRPDLDVEVVTGTLGDLPDNSRFDTILYIDVLEHIEQDGREVLDAFDRLRDDGYLVVLVPAHQYLFSPFDESIGHFRRYNKESLTRLKPADATQVLLIYLDSVGLLASLANKVLLRSAMPSASQIRLWDRVLVRGSRILDSIMLRSVGKSLIVVWRK